MYQSIGETVEKTCQSGSLTFINLQDIESGVEEHMVKWLATTRRNDSEQSRGGTKTKRWRKDYE